MVRCSTAEYPVVEQVYAPSTRYTFEASIEQQNMHTCQRLLTNRSLEVGETPWLLRTAIRQQTTGQRQELRDLPQASSSRRHPPSQNPLDKGASGVSSNNSSVYSWRPDFAWSATTPKAIDRKGCGGVPKSHNASHGL